MERISTKKAVFLLESNNLSDEKSGDMEGEILSKILHLSRVETEYYYFRTKLELQKLLEEFEKSKFRYLHIACHGDTTGLSTTFDEMEFLELSEILSPFISKRRIFFSACSMTNSRLARNIFTKSNCLSIMGPANDIYFGDAAVFWASFYTVLLRDGHPMSRERIVSNARALADAFSIDLNYFGTRNYYKKGQRPFTFTKIRCVNGQKKLTGP
jgi:hypothetical protein